MQILVQVKPNSKVSHIEKLNDNTYIVKLKSEPKDNKANLELINMISKYFNIHKSQITILKGLKSKHKIIQFYRL